ncbi:MAG: hypothetical protein JXR96_28010 [Deltaproteobacteria bacterium]|nr:hypothetical protein [Deltaproteobacteria bacterium]
MRACAPIAYFLSLAMLAALHPHARAAGEVVVTDCRDKTGTSMGRLAAQALRRALQEGGAPVMAYRAYLLKAQKLGLDRKALSPDSIRQIATRHQLSGVVTCSAARKGRYVISFYLLGPDGEVLLKKAFRTPKPVLPPKTVERLAEQVVAALPAPGEPDPGLVPLVSPGQKDPKPGPPREDDLPLVPLAPPSLEGAVTDKASGEREKLTLAPVTLDGTGKAGEAQTKKTEPEKAKAATVEITDGDLDLTPTEEPARALSEQEKEWQALLDGAKSPKQPDESKELERFYPEEKVDEDGAATARKTREGRSTAARKRAKARATKRPELQARAGEPAAGIELGPGSVPQIALTVGLSLNARGGLSPRYEASAFPGLRIEGLVFLGSVLDVPVLRDFGAAGLFNHGFGLKYSSERGTQELVDGKQWEWRAELVYRLGFMRVLLEPTLLLRFGYGELTSSLDTEAEPAALSAAYSYTYGCSDLHLSLLPSLRLFASVGAVFDVWPSDRLAGNGWGVRFGGGLTWLLFGEMDLSAGYEQIQFFFDEKALGETSDRFEQFYVRVGWDRL